MRSFVTYLVSGAQAAITGTLPCEGMDKFTAVFQSSAVGTGPPTGTLMLEGRIHDGSAYTNILTVPFNGGVNSGIKTQFDGPWERLRGSLSPVTSGSFNLAVRYSATKD